MGTDKNTQVDTTAKNTQVDTTAKLQDNCAHCKRHKKQVVCETDAEDVFDPGGLIWSVNRRIGLHYRHTTEKYSCMIFQWLRLMEFVEWNFIKNMLARVSYFAD